MLLFCTPIVEINEKGSLVASVISFVLNCHLKNKIFPKVICVYFMRFCCKGSSFNTESCDWSEFLLLPFMSKPHFTAFHFIFLWDSLVAKSLLIYFAQLFCACCRWSGLCVCVCVYSTCDHKQSDSWLYTHQKNEMKIALMIIFCPSWM